MKRRWDENSRFHRFLWYLGDLVIYNLLWLLFSLPLVTIGAATTALFAAQFDLIRGYGETGFRRFWSGFRAAFGPATAAWGLMCAIAGILLVDYVFAASFHAPLSTVLLILCFSFMTVFFLVAGYIFPLLSQKPYRMAELIRIAARLAVAYFPRSLLLLLLAAVPCILYLWLPPILLIASLPFWLFAGFSLLCNLSARILLTPMQSVVSA